MDVIVKVRDPDENLEEKIKAYKVKKRIKTTVTILAFVFALISSYLLVKLQTYTSLRTLQSYKNKETESSDLKYLQYADGMLKYGRDGIAYINKKGVEQWNQSYQIKDPVINVSGKAMAVAERGGNDIYVMDEKGAKGEIHTNYPIEKIAVAENGIVSTILNNENSPMVVCYDATGNVLVEHRASLTGTGYPIGIALSPNGTRLQISYLCVADGVEATRVGYLNFDNTEEANKEYQVADDVAEMRTVGKYAQIFRFDVHRYVDGAFRFQLVLFDERFQNITYCKLLRVQAESPAAFHTHGKYLFNQSTEALKLFLADTQVFVALGLFLRLVEVEQSVVGGICYGDGGFQFVGDVVGEIALHLFQCLLFQDGAYQEPEGESEYDQNNE